ELQGEKRRHRNAPRPLKGPRIGVVRHDLDRRQAEGAMGPHFGIRREQYARWAILEVLPCPLCWCIHDGERFDTLALELVARDAGLGDRRETEWAVQPPEQADENGTLATVIFHTHHSIAVNRRQGKARCLISGLKWSVRCCGHIAPSLIRCRVRVNATSRP